MSRIQKAYQTRFRWLLQQVKARRLDQGVQWLLHKAQRLTIEKGTSPADGLTRVYDQLAARPAFQRRVGRVPPACFFCDAGLGGLARWLRAAGHDAKWEAGIDDDILLQKARKTSATILTTDSMLMERRVIRDRILLAAADPDYPRTIAAGISRVPSDFGRAALHELRGRTAASGQRVAPRPNSAQNLSLAG